MSNTTNEPDIETTGSNAAKPQYIHEQHNSQCQQFFGPVTGCVFAMPGAHVSPPVNTGPAASSNNGGKTRKKKTGNDATGHEVLSLTFSRRKGVMEQHFALVLSVLQKEGWIMSDSAPDAFIDFFSGKECDCRIVWNPDVGKGVLRDLMKMMMDGGFVSCPPGYGYIQVIESHFIYPDGTFVRGLKSGYTGEKAKTIIDKCRKILMCDPSRGTYSDHEEILEMFSDMR